MSVSGINNYRNALYQWQGQKLNSTGNGSSSASKTLSGIFDGASMTSQIASMVELTKYAMDAMGVSGDSRVTFNQITKYRTQLQNEFNEGVKKGLAESGINDLPSLAFSLDGSGKISVIGGTEQDRKKAQAWLDANPSYGENLRKALNDGGIDNKDAIDFRLSSSGKMTIINKDTETMQTFLDSNEDLSKKLREGLLALDENLQLPLEFIMDGGKLKVKGEDNAAVNAWLEENPAFANAVTKELEKNGIEQTAVTIHLGKEGNAQIHVNNSDLNDAQAILDKQADDIGSKIYSGLSNLGIDKDISFSIQVNPDGSITIVSDHPDRDKVQKFFEENPDLIKKYRQIETLAGIDDARKAMQLSPSTMRKRIQVESMASWWMSSGNASSYFGSYNNGNMSLLSGLNINV